MRVPILSAALSLLAALALAVPLQASPPPDRAPPPARAVALAASPALREQTSPQAGAPAALQALVPVSLNASFRSLALVQGVPIGSAAWLAGGDELQPSNTGGGHLGYGWIHDHLLSAAWARAVVSNSAARPAFYDGAPARLGDYFIGCRPVGWKPGAEVYSAPNGGQLFDQVIVCGFDREHFPVSPLVAVARSSGFTVAKLGVPGGVAADKVAREMLRRLLSAQAGMFRNPDGSVVSVVFSDRVARYVCGNLAAATTLKCIDPADAITLHTYVRTRLLPNWLLPPKPPVVYPDGTSPKGGDLQVYNGVCWAVPALYDLMLSTPPGEYRREMAAALDYQCRKLALLQQLVPGHACAVESVATWKDLTAAGVKFPTNPDTGAAEYYIGPWGVRSMLVAGAVLGNAACTAEGMAEAAKWKGNAAQLPWMVLPDGTPITWN